MLKQSSPTCSFSELDNSGSHPRQNTRTILKKKKKKKNRIISLGSLFKWQWTLIFKLHSKNKQTNKQKQTKKHSGFTKRRLKGTGKKRQGEK